MIVFVQRDQSSNIIGIFASSQPGFAEEAIDDSDQNVVNFVANTANRQLPDNGVLKNAVTNMLSDIDAYQNMQDTGTNAQIQARDHMALKGLAQDMKLVLLYLKATFQG